MKWLKAAVLASFFLILMPFAFAIISVEVPEKEIYNLGENIVASVSIIESKDYNGFLRVTLGCEGYNLPYYTTLLSLEANFRTQITAPLPLFESMKGTCSIIADFEDTSGDRISRGKSKTFAVSDELNVSMNNAISALPNENIELEGTARKLNGESLQAGDAKISFRNKEYTTKVEFGNFRYTLALDTDLDIGNYPILVKIEDKNKNYGDAIVQLNVLPIATRIENRLESETVKPGNALKARIILYDHKDRAMNGTINVDLLDTEGKRILDKEVESLSYINYEFGRKALPGTYTIVSKMDDLSEETKFEVEALKEITMKYDDQAVIIENTGNVYYDDETTIVLESGDKKYLINKKIELEPGETLSIELSKEVPSGTYDVVLPQAQAIEENETAKTNVIEDVEISDERSVYKKAASGLGTVTGAVVGAGGYIASRPLLASVILVVIIILIAFYYSKGFILEKIRRKKPEDTNELFKDYKFEDEKE